jgi:hypothetical protein
MYVYEYKLDAKGRRVLVGLSFEETTEFEVLEAQLPMYHAELRWLELFNKHDHARWRSKSQSASTQIQPFPVRPA